MIAAVIAIPERAASVEAIRRLVAPSVDEFVVFEDSERRGNWWNVTRTLSTVLPMAAPGEPVLILNDDVVTVPDWRERWERIHAQARHSIYCLFSRQRHLFKGGNLIRGFHVGAPANGYYEPATIFVDRPSLCRDALAWFEAGGRESKALQISGRWRHFDQVMQEYLIAHGETWVVATPSLFDHRTDMKSSLGHKIGGSPLYVGTGRSA